jgi:mono/diheme cytochrome c family protein
MPRIPLTEKELADVTAYIMSLKDQPSPPAQAEAAATETPAAPPVGEKATTPQPTEAAPASTPTRLKPTAAGDVAKGKALYASKGCAICHGPKGQGTAAAPPLNEGHSPEEVKAQVRNPKGKMPAFSPSQISDAELEDLAAFVASLK